MAGTVKFEARELEGAQPRTFVLEGAIDEAADLSFLGQLREPARVVLRDVRRISSFGVRAWLEAIGAVPRDLSLEFVDCPPSLVDQCRLIHRFLGHGRLTSFGLPYVCESCGHEEDLFLAVEAWRSSARSLPSRPCPECGKPMEPDHVESLVREFLDQVSG
jgi:hypothetical protein